MNASQILNWLSSNGQLIVVAIVFILPLLGKFAKRIADSRRLREEKLRRERAELDALRTGQRVETVNVAMSKPRANQLAQQAAEERRRRAEESSRQRATARAQQSSQRSTTPQRPTPQTTMGAPGRSAGTPQRTRLVRLPGGIVLEVPDDSAEEQPRQPNPLEQRAQEQRQREQRQRAEKKKRAQAQASPSPASTPASNVPTAAPIAAYATTAPQTSAEAFARPTAAVGRSIVPATKSRAVVTFMGQPATRDQLRKAIVMSEIFGRPVSDAL